MLLKSIRPTLNLHFLFYFIFFIDCIVYYGIKCQFYTIYFILYDVGSTLFHKKE